MVTEGFLDKFLPPKLLSDWAHDDDCFLVQDQVYKEREQRVWMEKMGNKVVVGRCGKSVKRREQSELVTVMTEREILELRERHRKNVGRSCRRAYRRVIDLCEGIGGDRLLTLTFQENIVDLNVALLAWAAFIPLMYERFGVFDYVAVPERQKRGCIHFHVVLNRFFDWKDILTVWRSAVALVSDKTGGIDIRKKSVKQKDNEGFVSALARYVAKYVSKAFYCGEGWGVGRKRYYSNVKVERIELGIACSDDSLLINAFIVNEYNQIVGEHDYLSMFMRIFNMKFEKVFKKWSICSVFSGFLYRYEAFLAV